MILPRPRYKLMSGIMRNTDVQTQKAVTAYFSSEQLLPFGFAEEHWSQPTNFLTDSDKGEFQSVVCLTDRWLHMLGIIGKTLCDNTIKIITLISLCVVLNS